MAQVFENFDPYTRDNKGWTTKLPVTLSGTSATLAVGGTLTVTGTSTFTGAATFTGGSGAANLVTGNNVIAWTGDMTPVAGTSGNNTTTVAGTIYWGACWIPFNATLTGIQVLVGGTGGTDSWVVGLYNGAGTLVANSALAGIAVSASANTLQQFVFTATYAAVGPGMYAIALQSNGTTAKFQSLTVPGNIIISGSQTGVFGTLPALTLGTTYTNNVAPIASVY